MTDKELLKQYMLHVYKWHGSFDCSNGTEEINYDITIKEIQCEILAEIETKKLSENIISETLDFSMCL